MNYVASFQGPVSQIRTKTRPSIRRLGEADITVTFVSTGRVGTVAILTKGGVVGTLIDVHARITAIKYNT